MDKEEECICCKECNKTTLKLSDNIHLFGQNVDFSCITDHQRFQSICLDPWVLQVACLGYRQYYENVYEGPQHKNTGILPIDNMFDGFMAMLANR